MSCNWCEARLAPLVDGELTRRERALILGHVKECARCASVLEELRIVDGLLLGARDVRLAPNFTFATMAEVRTLPPPRTRQTPLIALVVCYLVGSWLLLAAALLLSPQILRDGAEAALDVVRAAVDALGGVAHLFARVAGWSVAVDGTLALVALVALIAFRRGRPRITERQRA